MPCNNHPAEHQAEQPLVSHESEQPAAEHETTQAAPKPKSPHQPGPQHGKISEDQNKALNIHNRARSDATKSSGHPRGNLVWDGELAANAATYAHKLASANKGLQHSSGDARPNQGENLYWSKPNGSMADASQGWVDEKKNYHGQKIGEGNFGSYGHYTQIIWPTSTRMGIGMAKAGDGGWFVVARYSPPGNWSGQSAFTGK